MESWLTNFITQSLTYSLLLVGIVSFLESLALVGLLLPGIILMTTLGTFIGDGRLLFYPAWISGTIGCLLGDWLSYYIGLYFKNWLYNLKFLKKNQKLFDKTKSILHKHSIIAIIVGRFIGPTRPLIPMIAGMLKLPLKKFIFPSMIGCILWPPVYFFPGIVTGITIKIPPNDQNDYFKWFLLFISILIWLGIWLVSKWWKIKKNNSHTSLFFTEKNTRWLAIITVLLGIISLIAIQFHPTMMIFRKILFTILLGL
ncbi:DedA family protein [Buchnera aphidicola]|uniref:Yabi n=1 Tax=Buchnera aphidicola str. USDA (Myzus persicae) TaxID=1009856 RepID=W0P0F4_BUCMP|nr:DedA family protein [Buchnera aphidicola]AHG60231.1 Yabi [Buchnera aphidicola str. USDA (Myzus persicae)]AHG60809.1 Yabi [Buchnera aphidicola str. W106 (Myzus persicae)]AHG61381.1 Yabi [Buchnera aphidicola str. G002 (Myzus persicae)]AHG61954.1 Yabi [Buchnera aphidicola str. F009 (Myzus persicae)]WAI03081.1 MAG: DedA family protein [Buchnera aphidicola (Myzus persicae)]